MAKTLAELKAENAKAEDAQTDENATIEEEPLDDPQSTKAEDEIEATEDESIETEGEAEPEEESEDSDVEDWMKSESQSDAEKKFTDGDIGKAKKKLRAKLEKQHSKEIDELKAENERLKAQPQATSLTEPKREDFYTSDDPDGAYLKALSEYNVKKIQAEAQASYQTEEAQRKRNEQKKQIDTAVDQHYLRAEELSEQSGISPELFQSSELRVRQAVENLYPDMGDLIIDGLIANLGEGSEKVIYNLGVNQTRMSEFVSRLKEDTNGFKAAMYLGELKAVLSAPQKRKTQAPKPAPTLNGDKQTNSSDRALKKRYTEAHNKGDRQAAFNAKREAKKAGVDTSNW